MLPSAARAIRASAASDTSIFSASAIFRSWSAIARVGIVRNSKTWERERIVSGILCSSVVAIMNTTCAGGSSIDLSSALNEGLESWCTSSMMKTLQRSRTGAIARPAMTTSRILSIPEWLAASISSTSMSRPCAISMQASHSPHGSGDGPFTQFSARARMRAVVVFPQPRGPANTNAWATRPLVMALRSVRVTACCPTTSSNRCGRHLRART